MKWYLETGPEGDAVISTRVRLARNIAEVPFPSRITPEQGREVIEKVKDALLTSSTFVKEQFDFLEMSSMTPGRAMSLAERHLVSPEFAQQREGRALLLSKDESVSIMLNEEDHIRIQTLLPGMQLEEALATANRYDDLLDEKLHYAFDENLGYLTSCPTNLGTGLRASLMLHLPALSESGAISNLPTSLSRLGMAIRGIYGEGSEPKGHFYQISNQITLGLSETQATQNLKDVAAQIIEQERQAREGFKKLAPRLEDKVYRSYGLLRSARLISADEFMSLISDVRLGVVAGVLKDVTLETINGLIYECQPATLIAAAGRKMDALERDSLRAEKIREILAGS